MTLLDNIAQIILRDRLPGCTAKPTGSDYMLAEKILEAFPTDDNQWKILWKDTVAEASKALEERDKANRALMDLIEGLWRLSDYWTGAEDDPNASFADGLRCCAEDVRDLLYE